MHSFSYLEPVCCSMSSSNCCFLTCIQVSQEAGQVVWYSHLSQNFPQFIVIHTVKDDAVKVLHSICQQIWKSQQWPQDWKRAVFIPITKKGNAKECSNYRTIALISHTTKVMLKILQPNFSNTWTVNLQMFKLVLEKAEKPDIKLPTSTGS